MSEITEVYSPSHPHPEAGNPDAEAYIRKAYEEYHHHIYGDKIPVKEVVFRYWYKDEHPKGQRFVVASIDQVVRAIVGSPNILMSLSFWLQMEHQDKRSCPLSGWWVCGIHDDDWIYLAQDSANCKVRYVMIAGLLDEERKSGRWKPHL